MLLRVLIAIALFSPAALAGVNVTTYHNDNMRTGANLNETQLTPANVNVNQFGKLFEQPVDGPVFAQPLYMSGVTIVSGTAQSVHNVIFIATENDSVYAFDADDNSGSNAQPLWKASFINPAAGIVPVPAGEVNSDVIVPTIGITGTPVIDPASGTLYVAAKTKHYDVSQPNNTALFSYQNHLHALDIHTGKEKAGSPVRVRALVSGTGDDAKLLPGGGGNLSFNDHWQMNRPALLLLNGVVYIAWGSHDDNIPYHGWITGYDAKTLKQVSVWNTTPNGTMGGFWMAGGGLAADASGNIYGVVANGSFDTDVNGHHIGNSYGNSVLRLSTRGSTLTLADYFTPFDQAQLNQTDTDLGSGGIILLPDRAGTHPHICITAGKEGTIYVLDRDNLGQFHPGADVVVQEIVKGQNEVRCTPAYFNNRIYYRGGGNHLTAFDVDGDHLVPAPSAQSAYGYAYPGATPSVSASGTAHGIVWDIENIAPGVYDQPAILHAYDADNVAIELYNSAQAPNNRDVPGGYVRFTVPTIANGKVYIGTQNSVAVYSLLPDMSSLTVSTSGSGSVSAAFSGTTQRVTNWIYSITATPAPGYFFVGWRDANSNLVLTHSTTITFAMSHNLALQAVFIPNPFPPFAGTYAGLSLGNPPSVDANGRASLTMTGSGAFTATVYFEGQNLVTKGAFLGDGSFSKTIARPRKPPVTLTLKHALSGSANDIKGSIDDGIFAADIALDSVKKSNAQQGRYTLLFPNPGAPGPQGDGYGIATVDANGNLLFSGALGDGVAVTQGTPVTSHGLWPFFVAPYLPKGSACGVLDFHDTASAYDFRGTIQWFRPNASPPISTAINAIGSIYTKPPPGTQILALTGTSAVLFQNGGFPQSAPPLIVLGTNNKVTHVGGNAISMSFHLANGIITGATKGDDHASYSFRGVVFQKQNYGDGLLKGKTRGSFFFPD